MHASFRASKVILSKVGTAASFGFGLNVGARYADSQSGHRIAIEEARALSLPHVDLREVEDTDLDVDGSELLSGFSCFKGRESAVTSQSSQLCESLKLKAKKVANEIHQRCAVAGALHITSGDDHRLDMQSHVNIATDSSDIHDVPSISEKVTQTQRPKLQSESFLQSYPAPSLIPKPEIRLKCSKIEEKEYIVNVEEDEKELIEQKSVKSKPYVYYQDGYDTDYRTWNSLVDSDSCTICSDLLAVPVVTCCTHEYCAICFYRLAKSRHDLYPIDCPMCREPIQRDEAILDVRRDGHIAEKVALFVQTQKSHCHDDNWEGKSDYEEWLKRREDYFMSRYTRVELEGEHEDISLDFDEEAELDDFPVRILTDTGGSESAFDDMNSAFILAMGLAMGALCCFLLAPSVKQTHTNNSLLKEMAAALWR